MVGGTNQNRDLSTFRSAVPEILIATPGRLNDNLQQVRHPCRKHLRARQHLLQSDCTSLACACSPTMCNVRSFGNS